VLKWKETIIGQIDCSNGSLEIFKIIFGELSVHVCMQTTCTYVACQKTCKGISFDMYFDFACVSVFFLHQARGIFYKPFNSFITSPWHLVFQHITRLGVRCGSCIKIFPLTLTKCGDFLGSGFGFGKGDVLEHMKGVHDIMHPLQTMQV
jgi:hypothetical protein